MPATRLAPGCYLKALLVLLLFVGLSVPAAQGMAGEVCASCQATECGCEDRHDDIWSICTRHAPGCVDANEAAFPTITFKRFDPSCNCWKLATAEEFFSGEEATLPTTFWVHGDRIEDDDVYEVGMAVYDRLVEGQSVGRLRYVIWSWPASVVHVLRPIEDARVKADNCMQDGYRLGWVLAQMPADTPVSLIGYSAAGRIIYGALHGIGGGEVAGHGLPLEDRGPRPSRYSVVTFATAIDNFWLEPGEPFGLAVGQVDRILLINNYCDQILQFYSKLDGAEAIGFAGLADPSALGEHGDRVAEVNVGGMIGPRHRWKNYIYSESVMAMIRDYALPQEGADVDEVFGDLLDETADGGDVELVDGAVVVIERLDGSKFSALERHADSGDVEVVDGVLVVVEDDLLLPGVPAEALVEGETVDGETDDAVNATHSIREAAHRNVEG